MLMCSYTADDIVQLCKERQFAHAESLAKQRLSVSEKLFGPLSASAIVSLSEFSSVYDFSGKSDLGFHMSQEVNERSAKAGAGQPAKAEDLKHLSDDSRTRWSAA